MKLKSMLCVATLLLAVETHAASSQLANSTSAEWGEYSAQNGGTSNAVQVSEEPPPRAQRSFPTPRSAASPVLLKPVNLRQEKLEEAASKLGSSLGLAIGAFVLWRLWRRR